MSSGAFNNLSVNQALPTTNVIVSRDLTVTGELVAAGGFSSDGTVNAAYFIGDGSQLTNVSASSNLAQVTALGNVTTSNITAAYFIGDGSQLTNLSSNLAQVTALGNVTTSNITAAHFIGDGSLLTNLPTPSLDAVVGVNGTTTRTITANNFITSSHYIASGSAITTNSVMSANLLSLSVTGGSNDTAGQILYQVYNTPGVGLVNIECTFARPYARSPIVVLTPTTSNTTGSYMPYVTSTATGFAIRYSTVATTNDTFQHNYIIMGIYE